MCRFMDFMVVRVVTAVAVSGLLLLVGSQASAQNPVGCTANASDLEITGTPSGDVIEGATITYTVAIDNVGGANCTVSNVLVNFTFPDGTVIPILSNAVVAAGTVVTCPGDPACLTAGPYEYLVDDADAIHLPSGCPPVEGPVDQPLTISAFAAGSGTALNSPNPVPGNATYCKAQNNFLRTPCIDIIKGVACKPAPPDDCGDVIFGKSATGVKNSADPAFCYSIIISNCSPDLDLIITNVNDTVFGDLTTDFTSQLTNDTLPIGGSVTNLFTADHSVNTTNIVTVLAVDAIFNSSLTDVDTAQVAVVEASISCDKTIIETNGVPITPTDDILVNGITNFVTYRVIVTNTGDAPLKNVSASDPSLPCLDSSGGSLAVGGTLTNICQDVLILCDATQPSYTNTVTVAGEVDTSGGLCGFDTNGVPISVTNTCDAVVRTTCGEICINIEKQVACVDTNVCAVDKGCASNENVYADSAIGAEGAAFCYSITVSNCATVDATITSLVDDQLGNIAGQFPAVLTPGQTETRFFTKEYPGESGLITNTVSVNVTNTAFGLGDSDTADAVVDLLPVGIECKKLVTSPDDQDGDLTGEDSHVSLPADGNTHNVTYSVRVKNTGELDLSNVTISDPLLEADGCALPVSFSLAAGVTTNFTLCTLTDDCPALEGINRITVSGEVDTTGDVCGQNIDCEPITTSSICEAAVQCLRASACRTTGGGKQIANDRSGEEKEWTCQSSDVDTPSPRYVTHGGQVGAPFAVGTICVTNTPCIRGEWQHVRHIKGGLRGVFHARSNGRVHEFDSLGCACLPCPEDAIVVASPSPGECTSSSTPVSLDYTNSLATTQGKRHELCNDGERVCGPEPRRAPANKIAFSGVGDYALNRGKKARQSVVFRVDIEDRSEPGGQHPGGATPPPDRYRIRIWFLKGNEGGSSGDPTTLAAQQLRCGVAVKDPLLESVDACRAPDIDDGGALDRGNHQLHPVTGATPPSDCGSEISPGSCGN